jgi:hypothetical protein
MNPTVGASVKRKWLRRWPALAGVIALGIAIVAFAADRFAQGQTYPRTNYSQIEDGLYLGGILSEPPPGTGAVLNLCPTRDPYLAKAHRWDPISDAPPAPSIDWLRRQVEFVDEQRRAGRTVFVHCRAGISRGGMVVTAYLMWRDGVSRDDALKTIRAKRSQVNPNPAFMGLLLDWEKSVKKPGQGSDSKAPGK